MFWDSVNISFFFPSGKNFISIDATALVGKNEYLYISVGSRLGIRKITIYQGTFFQSENRL